MKCEPGQHEQVGVVLTEGLYSSSSCMSDLRECLHHDNKRLRFKGDNLCWNEVLLPSSRYVPASLFSAPMLRTTAVSGLVNS